MAASNKRSVPEPRHHPGSSLASWMEWAGKDVAEVSRASGIPEEKLHALLNHEIGMSQEMAEAIGDLFEDVSVWHWRFSQQHYEERVAYVEACRAAEAEIPLLDRFRPREAHRQGWVPSFAYDQDEQVMDLRQHLGLESLRDAERELDATFVVIGDCAGYHPEVLAMWLRQGEIDVENRLLADFDAVRFGRELYGTLKGSIFDSVTNRSPFAALTALTDACARHGVGLVVLENMPDAGAIGATRWRADGKPWIQITFAHEYMDQFWYDFYRLAAHVLEHPGQNVIRMASRIGAHRNGASRNGAAVARRNGDSVAARDVADEVVLLGERENEPHGDDPSENGKGDAGNDDRVEKARQMAAEAEAIADDLMAQAVWTHWEQFASQQNITARYVERKANSINMHPGLLVARLMKEGRVPPDHPRMGRLRTRVQLRERDKLRALDV